jgi:hypothetical protein
MNTNDLFYQTLQFLTELHDSNYLHITDEELIDILDEYPAEIASPIYQLLGQR